MLRNKTRRLRTFLRLQWVERPPIGILRKVPEVCNLSVLAIPIVRNATSPILQRFHQSSMRQRRIERIRFHLRKRLAELTDSKRVTVRIFARRNVTVPFKSPACIFLADILECTVTVRY